MPTRNKLSCLVVTSACLLGSCALTAQQCDISTPVPADSIDLGSPQGVAADAAGDIYFTAGHCVLKLDTHAMLTRVAGSSSAGYSGDGGSAVAAQLNAPAGLAIDYLGNLYIADSGNNAVRLVTSDGNITTFAGTGVANYSGDGGPASAATLSSPLGVAADRWGDVYIADTNNSVIRKVAPGGLISTVAGNGDAGYSYDGFFGREAQLNLPSGVAVSSGNVYIADSANNRVRLITAARLITTFAGTGDPGFSGDNGVGGEAEDARLNMPVAVASDALGVNVFISDFGNGRVRHVLPNTIITTAAGGGNAVIAPSGIALDPMGNLFIADSRNSRILKLTRGGVLSTVAGK